MENNNFSELHKITQATSALGNTNSNAPKPNTRNRAWCFTYNNPVISLKGISTILEKYNYVVGEEIAPTTGTKHFQGYFNHKDSLTFNKVKNLLPHGCHISKAFGSEEQNYIYCSKEGNYITNIKLKKRVQPLKETVECNLKEWQQNIINILDGERDRRTINWVVDEKGNNGKTWLCKYILSNYHNCFYFRGGKANDIASQVIKQEDYNPEICLFDLPRTCEGSVSYNSLEQLKDGLIHTNKYEGGFKVFDSPHVIVFANFEPELEKLSKDRWNVINIK